MAETSEEARQNFAEKVRSLYLDHFGIDAVADDGEPAMLGSVLLVMEGNHLDGETSLHTFYAGSLNACKGMAWRFLNDEYEDDE